MNDFEKLCRYISKNFSWAIKKDKINVSEQFMDALKFTGMEIEPYEIIFSSYFLSAVSFILLLILFILFLFLHHFSIYSIGYLTVALILMSLILVPLFILHIVSEYPKTRAKYMKIHCLGDVPEVISYIVMYLKLNPNLENAFKFAATQSRTPLGNDLKKLMWDLEIRIHKSMDDAISYFAELWGRWNEYLKRAIHLIRSSIHEANEGERNATLDRSMDIVLEGTKSMMMDFSAKLHQPTLIIYSIGVMMPLAMVAMLPAISMVGFRVNALNIFVVYDIILPVLLFLYVRKILLSRPATFNPSSIPKNHPLLRKINRRNNAIMAIFSALILAILLFYLCRNMIYLAIAALWAVTLPPSIYLFLTYSKYKIAREEIKKMENEFGDALYVMGKRLMEDRPIEEAFIHSAKVLRGSKIGSVFKKAHFNLVSMRMNVMESLFDENYGALKHVYSDRIKAIMRLLAGGVKKGHRAAGVAIIKIAEHFKQLQEVEKAIKNALVSFTSSLRATAIIFAPMIAGITLGITRLMAGIFKNMAYETENPLFSPSFAIQNIEPSHFIFIIGLYVILLVLLLIRFANGIDEGDDIIQYYYSVGKTLPLAMLIFSIVTIFSISFFQSMV